MTPRERETISRRILEIIDGSKRGVFDPQIPDVRICDVLRRSDPQDSVRFSYATIRKLCDELVVDGVLSPIASLYARPSSSVARANERVRVYPTMGLDFEVTLLFRTMEEVEVVLDVLEERGLLGERRHR